MRWIAAIGILLAGCGQQSAAVHPTPSPTKAASAAPTPITYPVWSEEPRRILAPPDFGLADQGSVIADSDIAQLPDGRLRLYILAGTPRALMRSAVSSDGVHWTPEAGIRCFLPLCFGQPAIVAVPTGGWRHFFNDNAGFYSAITQDGLTFKRESGVRLRLSAFHTNPGWHFTGCHIVKLKEGGWRMYFGDFFGERYVPTPLTQIYSAHSENLLDWTVDPGVRVQGVVHPFVWLRPDGSYQMFASGLGQAGLGAETLYTATSADGLTWSDMAATGLIGGDPVAFQMADGKLRLYYNDIRLMPTFLSGFYSARMVNATWGVSVDYQTPQVGSPVNHITVQVMGSASRITVQAVDRARAHTVPAAGLPYAGTPPFQVKFDMPNSGDQLIEVTDGTIARLFLAYGPSTSDSTG